MSNLAQGNDDFPDAAEKNIDSANKLLQEKHYDSAAYLAGYAIECSLKTLIVIHEISNAAKITSSTALAKAIKLLPHDAKQGRRQGIAQAKSHRHNLNTLSELVGQLAAQANSLTAPYTPATDKLSIVKEWSEAIRYMTHNSVKPNQSAQWITEASKYYQDSIGKMRDDGVLT